MARPSDASVANIGGLQAGDALPIDRAGATQPYRTTPADIANYVTDAITPISIGAEPQVVAGALGYVWTVGPGGTKIWNPPGTPSAHAATHLAGGTDPINLSDLTIVDSVTLLKYKLTLENGELKLVEQA